MVEKEKKFMADNRIAKFIVGFCSIQENLFFTNKCELHFEHSNNIFIDLMYNFVKWFLVLSMELRLTVTKG